MLLAVDIGNSNLTIGIVKDHEILLCWRLATQLWRTEDEYLILIKGLLQDADISITSLEGSVLSCVVPPLRRPVVAALSSLVKKETFVVEPGVKIGMGVHYNLPSNVGADRIVNACAVKKHYGFPAIILDLGTATTFCVIDTHGDYCGGSIFPGIQTTSDALYNAASLLPRVAFQPPSCIIGKSTTDSIQSGMFYGYLDMINGMIKRILTEYPTVETVVSTGGFDKLICNHSEMIDFHDKYLTLKGLDIIYSMNTSNIEYEIW